MISVKIAIMLSKLYISLNRKNIAFSGDLPDDFTITCHAGALFTPPNSLHSIRAALEWGAQIVEFDVSFRPDGTPVIIHSSSPAENEGVLLSDALSIVAQNGNCKINLDIKSTANLPAVDKLVRQYNLFDCVFYTGVFEDWVETVKSSSEIPYYLNYNISEEEAENAVDLQAVAEKAISFGAIGINSNHQYANSLFVETVHKNGLFVSLWTANKVDDMCRVLKLKPDNVTTKNPAVLNFIINR